MLHLVHLKELKTFLRAVFFLKDLRKSSYSQTNTTQRSAMCELDSVALHHRGSSGRQRLAQRMLSIKISIQGNSYYTCFDYRVVYKREKDKAKKDR